ncbi:MAG: bifunctional 3'-5' exonuclease/DNA polymerase, partial [Selenomonadaceae bacterium]|nr:bifunctional 3'-5' exonuclease/DNA polymerase [Selenomonadaceae bacterium]
MDKNYKCVTDIHGIRDYLGNAKIVAFDFETAPNEEYRDHKKAALDPNRAHIVGCSFSVKEGTGIYVPIAHKIGVNIDEMQFFDFLSNFLTNTEIVKVAHNIAFESNMSYAKSIVIQPPVYDTIAAAQMTLANAYDFRKLNECGLKHLAKELLKEPLPTFSDVTDGRHFDELDAQDAETVCYGAADSDFALRLYHLFNKWFDTYLPKHKWIVENIESPTAVYLGIMKNNGVPLDLSLMEEKKAIAETERERLKKEIAFIIGDINIGANCSTTEFKKYLYEVQGLPYLKTTIKGQAAVDDMAMIMLSDWCKEHKPELVPLFKLVQEYRKWGKIQSTDIDGYLK